MTATPPPRALLWRAARLRCPVCDGSSMTDGFFTTATACERCGFRYERIEGHWLGSLGINTIVTFAALALVTFVGLAATWPEPPVVPLTAASVGTAAVVPVVFFPWSRSLWTAIDLWMRPLADGEAPWASE